MKRLQYVDAFWSGWKVSSMEGNTQSAAVVSLDFTLAAGSTITGWASFSWGCIKSVGWYYILPFFSVFPILLSGQATGMRSMSIYELGTDYMKYAKWLGLREGKIISYVFASCLLTGHPLESHRSISRHRRYSLQWVMTYCRCH